MKRGISNIADDTQRACSDVDVADAAEATCAVRETHPDVAYQDGIWIRAKPPSLCQRPADTEHRHRLSEQRALIFERT